MPQATVAEDEDVHHLKTAEPIFDRGRGYPGVDRPATARPGDARLLTFDNPLPVVAQRLNVLYGKIEFNRPSRLKGPAPS